MRIAVGMQFPKPETIQEEALKAVQAHPEIIKEIVLKTIRENPEIVMDVLKEKNIEVFQIVEKGSRDLAEKRREERLKLGSGQSQKTKN